MYGKLWQLANLFSRNNLSLLKATLSMRLIQQSQAIKYWLRRDYTLLCGIHMFGAFWNDTRATINSEQNYARFVVTCVKNTMIYWGADSGSQQFPRKGGIWQLYTYIYICVYKYPCVCVHGLIRYMLLSLDQCHSLYIYLTSITPYIICFL